MKDEIKEIERILATSGKYITYAERCYVLDCITNLQEELEDYKQISIRHYNRPYANKYLKQKRKELNNKNLIALDSETVYKDYYELKEKIDTALEIYEKRNSVKYKKKRFMEDKTTHDLMYEVLKGDDESENKSNK